MSELALPDDLAGGALASGRPKAAIEIASRLRVLIAELASPGDILPPERILVERFGVSRPTVREALRVLEVEGLVEIRRGLYGGAIVRDIGITDMAQMFGLYLRRRGTTIGDLFDFRMIVEPAAAARAAENFNGQGSVPVEVPPGPGLEPTQIASVAYDFHAHILDLAGNEAIRALCALVAQVVSQHYANSLARQDPTSGVRRHASSWSCGLTSVNV
jgi:DNA-binding FadR family transcriptional regulator